MDDLFVKPDIPFIAVYENDKGYQLINYFSTYERLVVASNEFLHNNPGYRLFDAFEIGSMRNIDIDEVQNER